MLSFFKNEMVDAQLIKGASGSYVDGRWVKSLEAPIDLRIIAPQPARANDLEMLPEGERVANYLKTWVDQAVMPRETLNDSDRIVYNGHTFKVIQSDDRNTLGGFYRVVMREIKQDEI